MTGTVEPGTIDPRPSIGKFTTIVQIVICTDCALVLANGTDGWGLDGAGYVEYALWSSNDEAGELLDALYDAGDLSAGAWLEMLADCADFVAANTDRLDAYLRAGAVRPFRWGLLVDPQPARGRVLGPPPR